jgi:hypothetical protein
MPIPSSGLTVDSNTMSGWADIHRRLERADLARMCELDAALAEDRSADAQRIERFRRRRTRGGGPR